MTCFGILLTPLTLQMIFKSIVIMSVPVTQLTVEGGHKEFNSLVDRIAAKYEQLDSGKFGAVGTWHLMLNQTNWLSCLLVWANYVKTMNSSLNQHNFTGCYSSSIEEHFSGHKFAQ